MNNDDDNDNDEQWLMGRTTIVLFVKNIFTKRASVVPYLLRLLVYMSLLFLDIYDVLVIMRLLVH